MDNALKYTPPGTTVILRAGADTQGGWLEVEDNGCGLPPEELARLFEPGYRQNQQVPGTGYGLTLARQMIEIQGGTLTAESTPRQATRLRIRLPGKPPSKPHA
jgi:signal transduction histidine kinase